MNNSHGVAKLDTLSVSGKWISRKQDIKTMVVFSILAIYFLVIGIILAANSFKVQEYQSQYDVICGLPGGSNSTCQVPLQVPSNMAGPVYFYYGLNNYFQNHRKYYSSKDFSQLSGNLVVNPSDLTDCTPIITNGENWVTTSLNGTTLDPNAPANPCGLIASTLFNDSFTLSAPDGSMISIIQTGIAWPEDVSFYKQPTGYQGIQWTNVTSEHFMVWMRPAGLDYFDKLWGIIPQGLPSGTYTVNITNYYDVSPYQGKKFVMVATRTLFGGKNVVLTTMHLTAAFFSIVIVIAVFFYRRRQSISKTRMSGGRRE